MAERAVERRRGAARAPQVRVAKWLPYTRGTVTDLDHLLGAASVVIDSADDALTLYTRVLRRHLEAVRERQGRHRGARARPGRAA